MPALFIIYSLTAQDYPSTVFRGVVQAIRPIESYSDLAGQVVLHTINFMQAQHLIISVGDYSHRSQLQTTIDLTRHYCLHNSAKIVLLLIIQIFHTAHNQSEMCLHLTYIIFLILNGVTILWSVMIVV